MRSCWLRRNRRRQKFCLRVLVVDDGHNVGVGRRLVTDDDGTLVVVVVVVDDDGEVDEVEDKDVEDADVEEERVVEETDGVTRDGELWTTVTRVEETVEGRGSAEEDRLQVAQQVKFAAGLEQSSVVHPAARSPYSHPATHANIYTINTRREFGNVSVTEVGVVDTRRGVSQPVASRGLCCDAER